MTNKQIGVVLNERTWKMQAKRDRPFENTNRILCEVTQVVNELLDGRFNWWPHDTWKAQTGSVNLSQVDRLSLEIGYVKRIGS